MPTHVLAGVLAQPKIRTQPKIWKILATGCRGRLDGFPLIVSAVTRLGPRHARRPRCTSARRDYVSAAVVWPWSSVTRTSTPSPFMTARERVQGAPVVAVRTGLVDSRTPAQVCANGMGSPWFAYGGSSWDGANPCDRGTAMRSGPPGQRTHRGEAHPGHGLRPAR